MSTPRRHAHPALPVVRGGGARETPYEQACRSALEFLSVRMPMATWSISRIDDQVQTHLFVAGDRFTSPGSSLPADQTLCHRMLDGGPRFTPDAVADPAYADVARPLGIRGYAAAPITDDRDSAVGVLCGMHDTAIAATDVDRDLVDLLAGMLSKAHEMSRYARQLELDLRVARDHALLDELTGLLNRRGWQAALDVAADHGIAMGEAYDVVIVDVDGLKIVNDTDGHLAGDDLLRRASAGIRAVLGHDDSAARIGGDEFALLVRADFRRGEIDQLVTRLRLALEAASVSASAGCAPLDPGRGTASTMQAADDAMYADKTARRERAATTAGV